MGKFQSLPEIITLDVKFMGFEQGSTVTWTSQAQGSFATKNGEVVEVVAAGKLPSRDRFESLYKGAGVGMPRKHESYVVSVDVGKTPGSSVRFYWPRVSALKEFRP